MLPLADLLAERAGEALERALGDALLVARRPLGDGAEHDDARAGLEAAQQRGEELLQRDQLGGVVMPVASKTRPLYFSPSAASPTLLMPSSSRATVSGLAEAAAAADDDGAVDQRVRPRSSARA